MKCGTIKNTAVLSFDVNGKNHVLESNEVEARKVCIRVLKEQDQNVVFAGDKICYKVTIYNDGCMNLCNLSFRDRLSNDIHYERNSFRVNGNYQCPVINGRSLSYNINELKAYEEMVITFECEVE